VESFGITMRAQDLRPLLGQGLGGGRIANRDIHIGSFIRPEGPCSAAAISSEDM
jgi:hypothetical protein